MKRSRIALLEHAMDIVFGHETGSQGERGWLRGDWRERLSRNEVHVCLNSALHTAERDLFIGDEETDAADGMRTEAGADAQQLLAETIKEMFPGDYSGGESPQTVIIMFNDTYGDAESMNAVLRKTEDKAMTTWLEDRSGVSPVSQSFIDYAVEGGVS